MTLSAKPSPDYLRYPTFAPLPRSVARCSGCGGSAFEFLLPQWKPVCKRCGAELKLPNIIAAPAVPEKQPDIQICKDFWHTAFLRPDGSVKAEGSNYWGQCSLQDWSGIRSIAVGCFHTVGLCADGTVKAAGDRACFGNTQSWSDISAIAAGGVHTVGLCADGTVKADGVNGAGQCNVHGWSNVTHVWAGCNFTAAMTADGTILCTDPNIQNWLRIGELTSVQICNVKDNSFILGPDGTVRTVTYGKDGTLEFVTETDGRFDIQNWSNIRAIAASCYDTVGLCTDGTVKAVGKNLWGECNVQDWSDITAVAAGIGHTVGLCADGNVKAAGNNQFGQCNVHSWYNVTRIWAGRRKNSSFTAALTADGTILCTDPELQEWFRKALA